MPLCKKCGNELHGKQESYCSQRCSKLHLKSLYKKRNRERLNEYNRQYRATHHAPKPLRVVIDIIPFNELDKYFTVVVCILCPDGQYLSARKRTRCPLHDVRHSKKLRFQVLKRDGFRCSYCGRRPPEVTLDVDHVQSWKDGGRTVMENLVAACTDCNIGKGAQSLPLVHTQSLDKSQ